MATELTITSYKNVLTILDSIKKAIQTLHDQTQLIIAASGVSGSGVLGRGSHTGDLNEDKKLIGYAVGRYGKKGKKLEWYYLVKNKVLGGTFPKNFVDSAYSKSTGNNCVSSSKTPGWGGTQGGRFCKKDKKGDNRRITNTIMVLTARDATRRDNDIAVWVKGQKARLNYILNDVVRYGDMLEVELNRVRIPMPENFRAWLMELRDTSIAVTSSYSPSQELINTHHLYEMTVFGGELAKDYNIIKTEIDKQISEIENAPTVTKEKPPVTLTTPEKDVSIALPKKDMLKPTPEQAPLTLEPVSLDSEKKPDDTKQKAKAGAFAIPAAILLLFSMV